MVPFNYHCFSLKLSFVFAVVVDFVVAVAFSAVAAVFVVIVLTAQRRTCRPLHWIF